MQTVQCPHCRTHFDFDAVTHLTPNDFHEKELLTGTLNCAICPQCGKTLNIPVRLIYRDANPRNPFMLIQEPQQLPEEQQRALALQVDESTTAAAMTQGIQRPTTRLVFTRPDFLEKLYLHRKGLDDRVVEFAKYQLFNGGVEDAQLSPERHRLLFDFSQTDDDRLIFLVYDRKSGRPLRVLQVATAEYRALTREMAENPQLRTELDKCFPGCRVDVELLFQQLAEEQK